MGMELEAGVKKLIPASEGLSAAARKMGSGGGQDGPLRPGGRGSGPGDKCAGKDPSECYHHEEQAINEKVCVKCV
jgi:hypothetical protein